MHVLPFQVLALAAAILLPSGASAHSLTRNPIAALANVRNATIRTPSARVTALSDFDLSFVVADGLHVKLRLEPNHDILGDDTMVTFLGPDGTVSRRENMERMEHKVFKGTAWVQQRARDAAMIVKEEEEEDWRPVGWARVSVHRDGRVPIFEGAFAVDHVSHHVQSSETYLRTRHAQDPMIERHMDGDDYMVMWRDSDILPTSLDDLSHPDLRRSMDARSCEADLLSFNLQPDHPVYKGMAKRESYGDFGVMDFSHLFGKRQIDGTTGGNSAGVNLTTTIGDASGCPSTRKVALVGVATDCTYTADFNSTTSVRKNIVMQMNSASGVWESTFNISLGLQNLTISDASCPGTPAEATEWNQACSSDVDIQARLNFFSAWRGTQQDTNSHWTLLSTCNTGPAVGLAWLGQACVNTAFTTGSSTTGNGVSTGASDETVSGANVVVRTSGVNEWQIIAHETGHTFGAVHDCTETTCSDGTTVKTQQCCPFSTTQCDAGQRFIMNPSTSDGIMNFSPCSVGNICSAIGRGSVKTGCLSNNRQVTTISGQQCGNGIVEPGEECDCGGTAGCGDNDCCNPDTCKFKTNAVCDDSNEDCCRGCQFANNGTVCRAATGPCDPQEICSGTSANCPADVTTPDGQGCGHNLQCASGQCTSRDQQCKSVMGSYTQGNDTNACDSSGCVISCASPEFGPGVCYGLQQNFLDGTICGGGGRCDNQQQRNIYGQNQAWFENQRAASEQYMSPPMPPPPSYGGGGASRGASVRYA
nr:disintegrin and metalloproteinase domain-containing protein b [Quercus suber]